MPSAQFEILQTTSANFENNSSDNKVDFSVKSDVSQLWFKKIGFKTIIDVGANEGQFADRMRKLFHMPLSIPLNQFLMFIVNLYHNSMKILTSLVIIMPLGVRMRILKLI